MSLLLYLKKDVVTFQQTMYPLTARLFFFLSDIHFVIELCFDTVFHLDAISLVSNPCCIVMLPHKLI